MYIEGYPILDYLFGCRVIEGDDKWPHCSRCGRGPMDNWTSGIFSLLWSRSFGRFYYEAWNFVRLVSPIRRCDECKKLMWYTGQDVPLCSDECYKKWIPF